VAFEACLIASSLVSHAMILELEETNKSLVIYNPQGHKTRNVPLHQQEDSCADQRLNPTKGETLWFEEDKLITIPGYKKPFEVDGEIEITLSPIARSEDCLKVELGLNGYNKEKTGDISKSSLSTPNARDPVAEIFQESLWLLDFDNLISQIGLKKTTELLMTFEKSAYAKGARRAYYTVTNGCKYLGPLCPVQLDHVTWSKSE
jgi:hypothetical protein